ncbi:hypothetical protein [Plantactinospora sp. KBS50]|uniref:hypothetical protein n=1 Tax=Plantactinospora sp. KBS50 TaxID=2024580 RepID=UPI000BAB2306|nr:hypothetical protein [Plantactinospora sp. KBS50]ASW55629.1 hypothetical protein CIK06_17745 [Plantactinospora sp. KBS50]
MSNSETPGKRTRRAAGLAALGGLAVGTVFGATLAATAAEAQPASVSEQFEAAFSPGAIDLDSDHGSAIVVDGD